jgi:5-methylcytosine-specific restriction endonuclease McrA
MIAYCKECGKQFRTHPSRIKKGGGKYCSIKCSQKNSIFKKENRHGRVWNSGPKVKKENKYSARQFRQREIQKAITRGFKKDCCEVCGVDNCELFLHHIVPLKLGGRSIKINCITVCRKCHSKVHIKLSSKLLEYFDDKQGELYEVLKSTVTDKYV